MISVFSEIFGAAKKIGYRGLLVYISFSIYIFFEIFENSQILLVYISINLPPQAKIFRISHVEMLDFPYKINEKHNLCDQNA